MISLSPLRSALALAPALLCLAVPGSAQDGPVTIEFAVAEGARLKKVLSVKHELQVRDMGYRRDGGPLVRENTAGWISAWERIAVEEEYLAVAPERPLRLRRTFRDISSGGKAQLTRNGRNTEMRANSSSPLQGRSLLFTWVEDEGEYSRMYDRLDAEEYWLSDVRGELELLPFLPSGPVEVGATWPVDISALRAVLAPSGNLLLTPNTGNFFGRMMEVGVGGDFSEVIGPELYGTIEAKFAGLEETDGTPLARIDLTVQFDTVADRTQLYRRAMPEAERAESARLRAVTLNYSFNGAGVLLWNLDAGHFHEFTLSGTENYDAEVAKLMSDGISTFDFSQNSNFNGQLDFELRCGPVEKAAEDE